MYPQEVRDSIRKYAASPVDFLKYGASGHVDMNFLTFSPRQQQAIVEEGHRAGKTVQAHTTSPESVDLAVEAGVDILTHGDMSGPSHPIAEETLKKIKAKGVAVSVLSVTKRHREGIEKHMPEGVLTPFYKISHENIRNFIKHGIRVLVSTDAGIEQLTPIQAEYETGGFIGSGGGDVTADVFPVDINLVDPAANTSGGGSESPLMSGRRGWTSPSHPTTMT